MQSEIPLAQRTCQNFKEGTPPIDSADAQRYLSQLSGWSMQGDGKELHKPYRFRDFANALAFVNRIGAVAEEQDHHPDILLGWGKAEITLSTHSVGGLSINDFILAAKIDVLAKDAPGQKT